MAEQVSEKSLYKVFTWDFEQELSCTWEPPQIKIFRVCPLTKNMFLLERSQVYLRVEPLVLIHRPWIQSSAPKEGREYRWQNLMGKLIHITCHGQTKNKTIPLDAYCESLRPRTLAVPNAGWGTEHQKFQLIPGKSARQYSHSKFIQWLFIKLDIFLPFDPGSHDL